MTTNSSRGTAVSRDRSPLVYEVEVGNAVLVRELVVTPAGKILSEEVEGPV
jgi:hypothetical protein